MKMNGVLVVGSANMDLVVRTIRFPQPGETVFGDKFGMFPGGKGANQAVASAKLGTKTFFVGKMGKDIFRDTLMASMRRDGVDVRHVTFDPRESTGIALITVDKDGQNKIAVVSGSNMQLLPRDIDRAKPLFSRVHVVLLQLEVPVPTVLRAAQLAKCAGAMVILNPAPAQELPAELLNLVDILTPNETECGILSNTQVEDVDSATRAANQLLCRGIKHVIVTLGSNGCLLVRKGQARPFPALRVTPLDTTGAGDAFNGALASALASGKCLDDAVVFANSAAGYSVTRMGAQTSMPTRRRLQTFLRTC